MARNPFTPRKTLALVAALLAIGVVVWWTNRGPREPVFEGKKLSWWFSEGVLQNRTRLTREQLQSLGPGALEWLAYQAGQTSLGDYEPSKLARTRSLILRWIRSLRGSKADIDEILRHRETMSALRTLGPEAALAATSDGQTRVRILLALAQTDFLNPEWTKQLEALAASPDPSVAKLAQAALAIRRNPWRSANYPSTRAGPAATPTPP